MGAVELRNKIFDRLNTVEDPSVLETVLFYIENFKDKKKILSNLSNTQLDEIDKRRAKYLSGESKSYSWKEIKQELIDEHGLQA